MLRTTGGNKRKGKNATGRNKECVITGGYYRARSATGRTLGLFFSFTFKLKEEGHNCVLSTMLTFKVSDRYNARLSW